MMTNETDEKTLEYQHKTEALYAADNFKKRFYPADPFDEGAWTSITSVGTEVIIKCIQAEKEIESQGDSFWLSTTTDDYPMPLLRLNSQWVEELTARKVAIHRYVTAVVTGDISVIADCRKQIEDSDDLQLKQDLIEADEILNLEPADMD
ncbi:hypothetical protein [Microcoleus sp.]|uniref:hypothetical protein n=1 Tax=Microcoleus sp. TaxID=44472 RepID=UPI003525DDB7